MPPWLPSRSPMRDRVLFASCSIEQRALSHTANLQLLKVGCTDGHFPVPPRMEMKDVASAPEES